jgi:Tfp pilus assembly protein PilN
MHDMNFFSVHKRSRSKNSSFKIFLIIFLAVVVLFNAALLFGGHTIFNDLKAEIQSMRDYINNPDTQDAIREAEQIKQEAELTTQYLNLLEAVDGKLDQLDFIDVTLLDRIRVLTPENTVFTGAQISGININLNCESKEATGPMDMYHAFRNSRYFTNVTLTGITIGEENTVFTINCLVKSEGGEPK